MRLLGDAGFRVEFEGGNETVDLPHPGLCTGSRSIWYLVLAPGLTSWHGGESANLLPESDLCHC